VVASQAAAPAPLTSSVQDAPFIDAAPGWLPDGETLEQGPAAPLPPLATRSYLRRSTLVKVEPGAPKPPSFTDSIVPAPTGPVVHMDRVEATRPFDYSASTDAFGRDRGLRLPNHGDHQVHPAAANPSQQLAPPLRFEGTSTASFPCPISHLSATFTRYSDFMSTAGLVTAIAIGPLRSKQRSRVAFVAYANPLAAVHACRVLQRREYQPGQRVEVHPLNATAASISHFPPPSSGPYEYLLLNAPADSSLAHEAVGSKRQRQRSASRTDSSSRR